MGFFKNRTVIGVICIILSLVICFAVTPLFNKSMSQKVEIVRVVKDIHIGDEITKDMVRIMEVGGYNLPEGVVKDTASVIGRFASADMVPGDYIIHSKVADAPAAENAYLYNLNGEKQAISVTVKAFANGLSGKLISGDIVSVIAPDYKRQGVTVIPVELQYVEVIAVTANSGYDANTGEQAEDGERELPGTVTLLVSPEQSRVLAELEADGKLHLSLVYRGTKENAGKFTAAQDEVLEKLYAPEEEDEREEQEEGSAEEGGRAEDTGNGAEDTENMGRKDELLDNSIRQAGSGENTEKDEGTSSGEQGGE